MEARDSLTPAGMMAYQRRTLGFAYPEAEVRSINRYGPGTVAIATPVAVRRAVAAGAGHPGFARITAPALGIFAERSTVEQEFWWSRQMNPPVRLLAKVYLDVSLANRRAQRGQFEREMPNARAAVIPGAHHFVFLSHPDQTERLMREFLLPPP
jgi:pimeloyl-ACP methyl ester carboxylesterase